MQPLEISNDRLALLKNTICPKDCTDDEFELFRYQCMRTKLDPFIRQIYMLKVRDKVTFLVSIDGLRLLAERSGIYAPGPHATFDYDNNGKLVSATAYALRKLDNGHWQEVSDIAYYVEYVQFNKEGKPNAMWSKMARTMLAKCAEAKLLRRMCPCDLGNLYAEEEIDPHRFEDKPKQFPTPRHRLIEEKVDCINDEQVSQIIKWCESVEGLDDLIVERLKVKDLHEITVLTFQKIKEYAERKISESRCQSDEIESPIIGEVLDNNT